MNSNATNMLAEGTRCEDKGDFRGAARHYREALAACSPDDRYDRGCLNINLGRVTEQVAATMRSADKQWDVIKDAVVCYAKATDDLANVKGEAVLQRGYAYMHLGRICLDHNLPRAVEYYSEAVRLFQSYPYTSQPVRVQARMSLLVATASFDTEEPLDVADLESVWREAQLTSSREIYPAVVINFASLLMSIADVEREHGFASLDIGGLGAWAGPELYRAAYELHRKAYGPEGSS
jgi:tetratricopeptide (TPR) repeat protein